MFSSEQNKFREAFTATKADKRVHGYHSFYNEIVADSTINSLLEIGVFRGASLKAWKKVWPDAIIEGMDTIARYDDDLKKEFTIHEMDSTIPSTITREYDMIVDDGDHHWVSQLQTFNHYFDKARKFYVIEDIMGIHAYDVLMRKLPKEAKDISTTYTSRGQKVKFIIGDLGRNIEYTDNYRFIIFDKR